MRSSLRKPLRRSIRGPKNTSCIISMSCAP